MPTQPLHDQTWTLAAAERVPLTGKLEALSDLFEWIPAHVPGTIQRDLMRAGYLPDLYQSLEPARQLTWVDEQDWWYHTTLPAIDRSQRAWLRFNGIDYQAAVTINGEELGRGAGMFAPREWNVSHWLQKGEAELGVRIWGGGALPKHPMPWHIRLRQQLISHLRDGIGAYGDRLYSLKAPVHYGWDFAPRVLAAGIWDDVTLHVSGWIALRDVWARVDWGPDYGLILHLQLDSLHARPITVEAEVSPLNFTPQEIQTRRWQPQMGRGRQHVILKWPDVRLRPWSTWDRGFPHLYRLRVRLMADAELLDEYETNIGARTVSWRPRGEEASATTGLQFSLNGTSLRLRGVNWTHLDLLHGGEDEAERYRKQLQQAVAAGVNAIRVWGGGGRERSRFYDLCDELGLVVWQELPFACVFFDHLPSHRSYLELVYREVEGIVKLLRQHPSLVLWGGGNEWGPGRHPRLARHLSEIVSRTDPSRHWLPASPGPGDSHNWHVWHNLADAGEYVRDPAPLLSEFGLAAPPHTEVLSTILADQPSWPISAAWLQRKAEPRKLQHYARRYLRANEDATSLEEFVYASQEAQARGVQTGVEAYRLRPAATGTFVWQWNEPWPAISWSILPYDGRPKRAYQQIQRSYAPLAPLARFVTDGLELWIVNDLLDSPGTCTLLAMIGPDILWREDIEVPVNDRCLVGVIPRSQLPPSPEPETTFSLHLIGTNTNVRNDYFLSDQWKQPSDRSLGGKLQDRLKDYLLRW